MTENANQDCTCQKSETFKSKTCLVRLFLLPHIDCYVLQSFKSKQHKHVPSQY